MYCTENGSSNETVDYSYLFDPERENSDEDMPDFMSHEMSNDETTSNAGAFLL